MILNTGLLKLIDYFLFEAFCAATATSTANAPSL